MIRLHAFADQLARADAEDAYRVVGELLLQILARIATRRARRQLDRTMRSSPAKMKRCGVSPRRADAAQWAALREEIRTQIRQHRPAQPRS